MKKLLKILGVILLLILVVIGGFLFKAARDIQIQEEDQKQMVKSDDELIGEHLFIDRDGLAPVDVNLYLQETDEALPLVVNLHGGAFVAGDADALDTQSARISEEWHVHVVTVNYSLMKDDITVQYATDEIKDAIRYFMEHSEEYHVDPTQIYTLGYSAGGYHAMTAALQLHKEGITIKGQILCYAFISDILDQFDKLTETEKVSLPPALFILAGGDPISEGSLDYEKALSENGVNTEVKVYKNVKHGFIEENNPEYDALHKKNRTSKSPEAEAVAREAEEYIKEWIIRHNKTS